MAETTVVCFSEVRGVRQDAIEKTFLVAVDTFTKHCFSTRKRGVFI